MITDFVVSALAPLVPPPKPNSKLPPEPLGFQSILDGLGSRRFRRDPSDMISRRHDGSIWRRMNACDDVAVGTELQINAPEHLIHNNKNLLSLAAPREFARGTQS